MTSLRDELSEQNGYCECPDLQDLYGLKREAEKREQDQEPFKSTLIRDLEESNRSRLLTYVDLTQLFELKVQEYQVKLAGCFREGTAKFQSHKFDGNVTDVKDREPEHSDEGVITVNCNSCNQQIDVVSDF